MASRTLRVATAALDDAGIPYALIGALAMAHHGVPRTTMDADLLVADPGALAPSIWQNADPRVRLDVRRGDSQDPLHGVVRIGTHRARVPVDVVVPRGAWLAGVVARAAQSGQTAVVDGVSLPLVTLEDLVLLKVDAAGTIDHQDIRLILEAWPERATALIQYVEEHLHALDPYGQDRWRAFVRTIWGVQPG